MFINETFKVNIVCAPTFRAHLFSVAQIDQIIKRSYGNIIVFYLCIFAIDDNSKT